MVGAEAAIKRELVRRLVHGNTAPENAPEFHENHPDLDTIINDHMSPREAVKRVLDVAACMMEEERGEIRKASRALDAREAELSSTLADRTQRDNLPEDMTIALEGAISSCGARNHEEARKRLGNETYDAIPKLGFGKNWAWLCRQPAVDIPRIAASLEKALGRVSLPTKAKSSRLGGGTHYRSIEKSAPKAVPVQDLPRVLHPMVHMQGVILPLSQLQEFRLTMADWNYVVGQTLKKAKMGFIEKQRFGAYLVAAVRRWEQNHPIRD